MASAAEKDNFKVVETLFGYLKAQGDADYIGEAVSQLQHSLQCAALAEAAGSDDELVLAALLHDVGRFLPQSKRMPKMRASDGTYIGTASHDSVGEAYLREIGFADRISQIVGAHVWAKRFLCATESGYWEALSKSSKATLVHQGGTFTPEQVEAARLDPYLEEKLAVRRWDDQAKVPGAIVPELDHYRDMAIRSLASGSLEACNDTISLHSRTYLLPKRPVVIICVDGFDPTYLEQGIKDGILPTLKTFVESGFHVTADVAMPTLTNPNNVSIITGMPCSVHGIAGNYFLDRATGRETMIVDDSLLRGSKILAEMAMRGVRVAAITAKDKLRRIIQHGLSRNSSSICYSAELASDEILEWLGWDARPSQYSAALSLFVLDAGVKLLLEQKADLFYLTLSDFIQHKYAPGDKESNSFLTAVDAKIKQLVDLGAVVAVTGDHGMNDKSNENGKPNVLFLQDELETKFGAGCARVICPITDPFVKHHGALGSFVRVYVDENFMEKLDEMVKYSSEFPQVDETLLGPEAAKMFEMPLDREGDFVLVAQKHAVLGSRAEEHDLTNLDGYRLRSHGGKSEQQVPLLMSQPLVKATRPEGRYWRNFDVFDLALNYGQ